MKSALARGTGNLLLGTILFLAPQLSRAQKASPPGDELIPGWKHWTKQVEDLDSTIIARLPERLRNDPQVREGGRTTLAGGRSFPVDLCNRRRPDHPVFVPAINFYLNIGQPNTDTTYRTVTIDGAGSYRIRGEIGSDRILRVGIFRPIPKDAPLNLPIPTYYDFNRLHIDAKGHFDVLLSPQRPAG